jgi:hypothetical protein
LASPSGPTIHFGPLTPARSEETCSHGPAQSLQGRQTAGLVPHRPADLWVARRAPSRAVVVGVEGRKGWGACGSNSFIGSAVHRHAMVRTGPGAPGKPGHATRMTPAEGPLAGPPQGLRRQLLERLPLLRTSPRLVRRNSSQGRVRPAVGHRRGVLLVLLRRRRRLNATGAARSHRRQWGRREVLLPAPGAAAGRCGPERGGEVAGDDEARDGARRRRRRASSGHEVRRPVGRGASASGAPDGARVRVS